MSLKEIKMRPLIEVSKDPLITKRVRDEIVSPIAEAMFPGDGIIERFEKPPEAQRDDLRNNGAMLLHFLDQEGLIDLSELHTKVQDYFSV